MAYFSSKFTVPEAHQSSFRASGGFAGARLTCPHYSIRHPNPDLRPGSKGELSGRACPDRPRVLRLDDIVMLSRGSSRWDVFPLAWALALMGASSCGMGGKSSSAFSGARSLFVEELEVDVVVSPELNGGRPLAVDLIVAYDESLMDQLVTMSAADWFEQRDQFARDFADAHDSWNWEWVPGQRVETQRLPIQAQRSVGGVIFADYRLPGTHRARIDLRNAVSLSLGEDSFSIQNR